MRKGGDMKVNEVMTRNVITVPEEMSVHELAELLVEKNISGAPVVDREGKLVGVVQEEGVIFQDKKVHLPTFVNISLGFLTLGIKRFEEEMKKITANKVGEIMDKDFLTISPDISIEDAATIMIENKQYYFPVLSNDKLVGVMTKKDIVRAIANI